LQLSKKKTRHRRPPSVLQARVADISRRLLALRTERGLTQGEVAEVVGVTQAAMSRWEDPVNPTIPSAAEIAVLSEFYHVTSDWLCGRTEFRDVLPAGEALVDEDFLRSFELAKSEKDLDRLVDRDPSFGAAWTSIPQGARIARHDEILRRVKVVDRHVRKLSPRHWDKWIRRVLGSRG
jgi:transcriptional regulator with XRE-family HTH domain